MGLFRTNKQKANGQCLEYYQKVVCRHMYNDEWQCNLFSHYRMRGHAVCIDGKVWEECLPFNEDTKELIGTKEPYAQ